jgi:hypothetical protein
MRFAPEVRRMTMLDVQLEARSYGFTLDHLNRNHTQVWQWRRGRDGRGPSFPTEGDALAWMDLRLRTASLFNR